uniref:Uncharacterized protein n=1 Tax=Oryza glumipatula TaxID=40148 RepID=A0A0D9Y8N5_9ORYZ
MPHWDRSSRPPGLQCRLFHHHQIDERTTDGQDLPNISPHSQNPSSARGPLAYGLIRRHAAVALSRADGDASAHAVGRRFPASRNGVRAWRACPSLSLPFSSSHSSRALAVRPTSIAIGAASIHSIISMVCELELEMWYLPISCESFEPSGSQLLKRPGRICLHLQVVIHYFDKQSAEFINSAAGAITVSYVMQLLTGRICIMCFLQRDNVLGVCKEHV